MMADLFERAIQKLESDAVAHRVLPASRAKPSTDKPLAGPEFMIDFNDLKKRGFLTPGSMQGHTAEEYRIIKRLLLMSAFGKGAPQVERGNAIVVTSALEGEGKTFTSLNLAISIAQERDSTVLLVDTDLTRRSLSHLLGADKVKGLTDLLTDPELDLGEVIGKTNVDKLRFIPAGSISPNNTELLASEQMEQVVLELINRYEDRIILFDSTPLLATSQAVVITHLVGQVLMIVEEGRTSQAALKEAVALIDDEKLVGMVLNRCSGSKGGYSYGSYYGPSSAQSE